MPVSLQAKLAAARLRWRSFQAMGGFAALFAFCAALSLASFHTDRLLVLGTGGRQLWLWLLIAGFVLAALVFLVMPLLRPVSDEAIAVQVERRFPALGERLLTTLHFAQASPQVGVSGSLVAQLARETETLAQRLNFVQAISPATLLRPTIWAWSAGILLLAHIMLAPESMQVWLRRIWHPGLDIPLHANTRVWVGPGDHVVPRGENVRLNIRAEGQLPKQATLHYRADGGTWAHAELTQGQNQGASRTFSFHVNNLQQSLAYYATAGDGRSNPHRVRVEDRPAILQVRLHLSYPPYTKRASQTVVATAGNIVAPVGTQVDIAATANKPLGQARLMVDGQSQDLWPIRGAIAQGRLRVTRDQTYGLRLRDRNGFAQAHAAEYTIRAQPDQAPTVQLVRPAMDLERTPNGNVDLDVTATDDYGVRDTRLFYRVGANDRFLNLPIPPGRAQVVAGGVWNLSSLSLKAGDTIAFGAVARDNRAPHAQTGRSATYRIRIVGVGEMRDRLEARLADEQQALSQLRGRQQEAQKALARVGQSPEQPQAIASAQSLERAVGQEAAELASRMQQTVEQMRENNVGSASVQARRAVVQKTLAQLAQNNIPQAADAIAANKLAQAARGEQAVAETLEKLAQQIAPAPSPSELAQQAEQLARDQQRLAEQAGLAAARSGAKPPGELSAQERATLTALAGQQAGLRAQTNRLEQQVQQAAQSARERKQPGANDLQKAAQQLQQAGVSQKQTQAQRQLQAGKPSSAEAEQNQAAAALQKLADQLAQSGQNAPDPAALRAQAAQLEQAAAQLDQLAQQQNSVRQQNTNAARQAEAGEQTPPSLGQQLAEQEQALKQATEQVGKQLQSAPQAQRQAGRAAQSLEQAASRLEQNALKDAQVPSLQAQKQLEQAARQARAAGQAAQQQAAAGQAQRDVEQLAREQRALVQETQQLDRGRPGATSKPAQREQQRQIQALAQKQSALSRRGQKIAEQMPSRAFTFAQNEANRRMTEAAANLRQKKTDQATQRPQEHAAQTLERIARALGEQQQAQAQASQTQQQAQGTEQQAEAAAQTAQALGALQVTREMEAQLRQETTSLHERQKRNPDALPTREQQRELGDLHTAQRATQNIAQSAAQLLRTLPQALDTVRRAQDEMENVQDLLQQQQTGKPTQEKQGRIVSTLDQALSQVQQALAEQTPSPGQAAGQQPQPGGQLGESEGGGSRPPQAGNPLSPLKDTAVRQERLRGREFGGLTPRAQRALREGQNERVPAEYRDLVNQYYKALGQRPR